MRPTNSSALLRLVPHLCLLLLSAACGGAPKDGASTLTPEETARIEAEVREVEDRFNGAYARNDMETYWTFYDDDLTQWMDSGRLSLERYRRDWTAMLEAGGAVLEARMEDLQVMVSPAGDAAVASYRLIVRLRDGQGKETSGTYHESDTWFRRDGQWKVVHLHYSAAGGGQTPAPGGAP